MYTTKVAAARVGLTVPLLRAWERRYGIVAPMRAASGYRLYDGAALDRLRQMKGLVEGGWSPSAAAAALLAGSAPSVELSIEPSVGPPVGAPVVPSVEPESTQPDAGHQTLVDRFVTAAAALDGAAMDAVLDEMVSWMSFERVADEQLLPAMAAIGDAWQAGRIDVAAEHAASSAVHARLAAAFRAGGRAARGPGAVLVGMPPAARHELGALAFAVAARRAGMPIVYLGSDLPGADWVAAATRTHPKAAVIGAVMSDDVGPAAAVASALIHDAPGLVVAFGGRAASDALAATTRGNARPFVLPDGVADAVDALGRALTA